MFTITPRPLVVRAHSFSKIYGNADPAFTYSIASGSLVGEDALSGELTRAAGEDAGVYAIKRGTLANANYTIAFENGLLIITPRPITVSAHSFSKVVGEADPSLTYTITEGDLVGSDTLSGALTRPSGESAGAYPIRQGTLRNANYAITFEGGILTITARAGGHDPPASDRPSVDRINALLSAWLPPSGRSLQPDEPDGALAPSPDEQSDEDEDEDE